MVWMPHQHRTPKVLLLRAHDSLTTRTRTETLRRMFKSTDRPQDARQIQCCLQVVSDNRRAEATDAHDHPPTHRWHSIINMANIR